jgi:mRNA-degrading endonuclease YafQ of YafQ-DinJ toxin-antitoxin module
LYNETLSNYSKNQRVLERLKEFITHKRNNPTQNFGTKDQLFSSDGILKSAVNNESMKHAHLTHDVSILYTIQGRPPLIKLYGIFSHDELGTGQPSKKSDQRKAASRLSQTGNWKLT